ncbi:MAG TPA: phenylacetate-CoA oxygenase subunit PaaJ [Panacibacter sp.]|nr:phenylacetate-CoA oxygenase subunit PaaJ [Panacibacter sp.]HNP44790.1 phenylacetate-CoA oxygenase subunit PaaJ [Panacibacter sp.]
MPNLQTINIASIWRMLEAVTDPEIPVLSVVDMGIIRAVRIDETGLPNRPAVEITITPTYTGCPAMDVINTSIRLALIEGGITKHQIKTVLYPAWSTDWITESGKQKLKAYGIAPPQAKSTAPTMNLTEAEETIQCPQCNSTDTKLISRFGSTACKALYQCQDCKEPFDYFKCH